MPKPSIYLAQGYNCAESLIKCYNEEYNEKIPMEIGSSMGGGAGVGSLCGAINSALVVIGYLKGRKDSKKRNIAINYSREYMTRVREKYSVLNCIELKTNKVPCTEITDFSYEILKEMLEKQ